MLISQQLRGRLAAAIGPTLREIVVVVPAHDERARLLACLASVAAAADQVAVPVTVVVLEAVMHPDRHRRQPLSRAKHRRGHSGRCGLAPTVVLEAGGAGGTWAGWMDRTPMQQGHRIFTANDRDRSELTGCRSEPLGSEVRCPARREEFYAEPAGHEVS
jgi:hypothetical protein